MDREALSVERTGEKGSSSDRFTIVKRLGEGAQGLVYLANDTYLGREVAIKSIHLKRSRAGDGHAMKRLLEEARIVSRLRHPNIVTLYDAGEREGEPYLVFEYVQGETLDHWAKTHAPLSIAACVDIVRQILAGVSYAHEQQVIHRDLKPSNIMIDREGMARIMDFGIATSLSARAADGGLTLGTPLYLAPECATQKTATPQSDLFSVSLMLYELLAGEHPVRGAANRKEVLDQILHRDFDPPSRHNPQVDEKLDSLVMRGLDKDPQARFASAEAMSQALEDYLAPHEDAPEGVAESSQSTLDFLLRRMRHKSDFPALSQAISAVNRIAADAEHGNVASLSNAILKDFALTNKLLRLVNAALYNQFGGAISTVSRAVVILGFDTVKNIAVTLMLFEHLQHKAQAEELKDEMVAAFFTGVLAKQLASRGAAKDGEEAFICALFQSLGRLLALFYFHEEAVEINKLIEQKGMTETNASAAVLGLSYEELAIGVARAWHFPEKILTSMRTLGEEPAKPPQSPAERLRLLSNLASELSRAVTIAEPDKKGEGVKAAAARFSGALGVSEGQCLASLDDAVGELHAEAFVLGGISPHSRMAKRLAGAAGGHSLGASARAAQDTDRLVDTGLQETVLETATVVAEDVAAPDGEEGHVILTAGIQDITNTLVGEYSLNDLLRMVLETMYRAMKFSRVVFCFKDARANAMMGRFGFGADVERVLKQFRFSLDFTPDVFHVALSKGLDILISDVGAENIKDRIPPWFRTGVGAPCFIIFPVIVDKKIVGMFYADRLDSGALTIGPKELSLLKTLRNQAVLAIKQKI
ncbi:MAG: protein kinase [Betaproteobacteria bacterium]|nr:protein kinase [Betaproteobacteria bacterium]